jgi:16S rRNA (cytosine1402-N4)-methyltransferase
VIKMEESDRACDEEGFLSGEASISSLSCKNRRYHTPVLLEESMSALAIKPDGIYIDCTLGGGGHFQEIVNRLDKRGIAVGIDRDPEAISWCRHNINCRDARVELKQKRFSRFREVMDELEIAEIDGMLIDLGVSTHQINSDKRGFSYMRENNLDMRMNPSDTTTAADIFNSYSVDDLARILLEYGEIINPLRMAKTIKRASAERHVGTSGELKECLRREYGDHLNVKMLAKLFQALRIEVNGELTELKDCCMSAIPALRRGGRLVVISYHSLEDRFVKNFMRDNEKGCVCPTNIPVCVCGRKKIFKRINHKAIVSSAIEVSRNPASRSARLRAVEKFMNPISEN